MDTRRADSPSVPGGSRYPDPATDAEVTSRGTPLAVEALDSAPALAFASDDRAGLPDREFDAPRSTLEGRMMMVTADFYALLELLSAAIARRTFLEDRRLTACVEYRDICRAEKALRVALVIPAEEWTEPELREAYGR